MGTDKENGSVLLVTLIFLLLLSVIILSVMISTQSHSKIVSNEIDVIRAEGLAKSGANSALLFLSTEGNLGSLNPDSRSGAVPTKTYIYPDGQVDIYLEDERGKSDLNVGVEAELEKIISHYSQEDASILIARIKDFIDGDDTHHDGGSEVSSYEREKSPYRPKNKPFSNVEELSNVMGFEQIWKDIAPLVTVHSRSKNINFLFSSSQINLIFDRKVTEYRPPIDPVSSGIFTLKSIATTRAGTVYSDNRIVLLQPNNFTILDR